MAATDGCSGGRMERKEAERKVSKGGKRERGHEMK